MTEHKATPEQWAADRYDWARADTEALDGDPAFRCIMELRARVEALEAAAESNCQETLDSSLVERVAGRLTTGRHSDARAAILEIAAWLRQRDVRVKASVEIAADLERAAAQHLS